MILSQSALQLLMLFLLGKDTFSVARLTRPQSSFFNLIQRAENGARSERRVRSPLAHLCAMGMRRTVDESGNQSDAFITRFIESRFLLEKNIESNCICFGFALQC